MSDVGPKLKLIRVMLEKTQSEMADLLGIKKQSTYGNYERNLRELPQNVISKLILNGININWLYGNVGEPFLIQSQIVDNKDKDLFVIPIIKEIKPENDPKELSFEEGIKIVLPWRPCKGEIGYQITEDYMEPKLYDGDYITAAETDSNFIQTGKDYLIISEYGSQVRTIIFDDNNKIALISENPKYKDQKFIPKKIIAIYEILTRISPYRTIIKYIKRKMPL